MKQKHFITRLNKLHACEGAVEWAKGFDTWQELWQKCDRGDWMLWIVSKFSGKPMSEERKPLVLASCACTRLSLKHIPEDEKRLLIAIETAEKWAMGDNSISIEKIKDAADAAAAAAAPYDANSAYYAAYCAAYCAVYCAAADDAAADSSYAANSAYYAANSAYYAAYCAADDYATAKKATLKKCAEITRKHFPNFEIR